MPSTSGAQHRAMEAAAHGHSTLGIPKSVGKEFVKADTHRPSSSLEAMTGMKKGTHRGKRSRGKGRREPERGETMRHEGAESHKKELDEHMAQGNHAKAKNSALMLAKALHKQQKLTASKTSLTPNPKTLI